MKLKKKDRKVLLESVGFHLACTATLFSVITSAAFAPQEYVTIALCFWLIVIGVTCDMARQVSWQLFTALASGSFSSFLTTWQLAWYFSPATAKNTHWGVALLCYGLGYVLWEIIHYTRGSKLRQLKATYDAKMERAQALIDTAFRPGEER